MRERDPREWETSSEAETAELGRRLAAELAPAGTLLLYGDLGSGKTVLTRGLASGLGIEPEQVQSPTFTLMREHLGAGNRLIHVDLYRLSPEEVGGLGLDEVLADRAVTVVEWAERISWPVEADLRLELTRGEDERTRRIRETTIHPATMGSERGEK